MPGSTIALAAPLYELRDLVGTGWPDHRPAVAAMDGAHGALSDIAIALGRSWDRAAGDWSGISATAAAEFASRAAAEVTSLAKRARVLSDAARDAGSAVARARLRLQAIIDRFEERVAALAPHLDEPAVAQQLRAEARRAITEATAVVDELGAELDRQAGLVTGSAAASAPAPPPAAGVRPGSAGFAAGSGGIAPEGFARGLAADLPAASGGGGGDAPVGLRDPAMFGDGVALQLPDGSTAVAPNSVAASAVRHALTQLGVPYRWGGTTPGVGLDCSGLTQWAYHEAGLDIPRLAQEQDIGKAVPRGSLRPGDLAVWDGHVAMVVGPNTMIEAGDPVKLSPIRTTNAGQGFQGFWRPTA